MKKFNINTIFLLVVIYITTHICGAVSVCFAVERPIATDSRIRTFVYSEHEVFRIVVHYGYQTNIEFADGEEVQTISVGNNYAWQLSPLGRRLFIKPLEENILTNMTIITNKRSYQFELQSKNLSNFVDEELIYVVRFFYPDERNDIIAPEIAEFKDITPIPELKPYNFDYRIQDATFAPVKVFDDGINTYFKFPNSLKGRPGISLCSDAKLIQRNVIKDYILVNVISDCFVIQFENQSINVINTQVTAQKNGKAK